MNHGIKNKSDGTGLVSFRLPNELHAMALSKCREQDLSFSELMRRALGREIGGEALSGNGKPAKAVRAAGRAGADRDLSNSRRVAP